MMNDERHAVFNSYSTPGIQPFFLILFILSIPVNFFPCVAQARESAARGTVSALPASASHIFSLPQSLFVRHNAREIPRAAGRSFLRGFK
jgi:hypothetical protein